MSNVLMNNNIDSLNYQGIFNHLRCLLKVAKSLTIADDSKQGLAANLEISQFKMFVKRPHTLLAVDIKPTL